MWKRFRVPDIPCPECVAMKKETVLLVEDEPLLGELLTEALTEKGFEVHTALDAGDALRFLLSGADVAILFTDIDLGEGMDGVNLARIAHEMRPSLPIIYSSGRRGAAQIETVPGSAFLPKPYSLSDVDATIAQLIGKH
jgi:CheY-like chemotaxis protein